MPTTQAEIINADLLAFIQGRTLRSGTADTAAAAAPAR
jgi:hypothetical protein